jgi:hypothetical protein
VTVAVVFVVLLGLVVGVVVAFGPLSWLQGVGSSVAHSIVVTVSEAVTRVVETVPGAASYPNVVATFSVLSAVATPGLVALALVWCARPSSAAGRSTLAGVFAVAAATAFFFAPPEQAFAVAAVFGVVALVLVSPLRKAGQVAGVALAVTLAVDMGRSVVAGSNRAVSYGVDVIADVTGLYAPEFWTVAVCAVAAAPFVAAAGMALRGFDGPPQAPDRPR